MQNYKAILEPDSFYHIYNRANGSEKLFLNDNNYLYFLKKYNYYISPIADTFAYCLMPNHFHFLVRIKALPPDLQGFENLEGLSKPFSKQTSDISKTSDVLDVLNPSEAKAVKNLQGFGNLEGFSQPFSNLFNSYTKAYNKQNNRKGSLFMPRFNRKKITSEDYLKNTLNYIHQNPVTHGYVAELDDWKYSSYTSFTSNKPTKINKDEAIKWFDDIDNFIDYHNLKKAESYALEMDLAY